MAKDLEKWLSLTPEEPLEPELPICDAHHHLWDHPGDRYLLEELSRDTGGHKIVQTVFVDCRSHYRTDGPEAMRPVGETTFVQRLTAGKGNGHSGMMQVAAGIVSFADLTLGAGVTPVLQSHIAAGQGRFRGIRNVSAWNANPAFPNNFDTHPGLLLEAKFREGFACLHELDLSFDAFMFHPQMADLLDLAQAFPQTSIVLNHFGAPLGLGPYAGKRDEVFEDWRRSMAALAACPNVSVKLGGMGMPICGFGWEQRKKPVGSTELAKAMETYYLPCIEMFGVSRCMFESNFPVDKMAYSYIIVWNAFKRLTKRFSQSERAALFHDTAASIYRLKPAI